MTSTGQKIFFQVDQQVAITLASDSGVLKEGKYGPYWTYFLEDDRIMFVPPMVAELIQKLGITVGQILDHEDKRAMRFRAAMERHTTRSDARGC